MVWDGIAQGGRCLGAVTRSTEVFYRRRLLDRAAKFRERGVYNVYEERLSVHRIAPPTGTAHRAWRSQSLAQHRRGAATSHPGPGSCTWPRRATRPRAEQEPRESALCAACHGPACCGESRESVYGECAGRWAPFVAKRSSAASWLCAARSSRASPMHSAQREAPEDQIRSDNRQKANGRLFLPPRQLEQSYE